MYLFLIIIINKRAMNETKIYFFIKPQNKIIKICVKSPYAKVLIKYFPDFKGTSERKNISRGFT